MKKVLPVQNKAQAELFYNSFNFWQITRCININFSIRNNYGFYDF